VEVDGEWTCPVAGAARHLALHDAVHHSRLSLVPFEERRDLAPVHQPAR
jgi:DNA polymerase-3 subunit epsilon